MHNLYTYHSFMEAFKILKLRLPTTLYSEYHLAHNRHTRLITPSPSSNFLYNSSLIWNKISQKLKITDFSANISLRGGDNGYFFVKLDFEIAVDQQTRTSDRTFEGVPDPNRQTVPAGQPRPYLVQIRPNLAKYPEHAQNPYFMCSTCS